MWLGRLIDKARQYESAGIAPGEMLGEYMFGDSDYMDAKLLRFLGLNDAQLCEVIRYEPDDERAARRIVELSGKSAVDCAAFNRRFSRYNGLFLAMMDADEGRCKPGMISAMMKSFYNAVVFPIGIWMYRSGTRKRQYK